MSSFKQRFIVVVASNAALSMAAFTGAGIAQSYSLAVTALLKLPTIVCAAQCHLLVIWAFADNCDRPQRVTLAFAGIATLAVATGLRNYGVTTDGDVIAGVLEYG